MNSMRLILTLTIATILNLAVNAQNVARYINKDNRYKIEKYFTTGDNVFSNYENTDLNFTVTNDMYDSNLGGNIVHIKQKINDVEIFNAIATFFIKDDYVKNTSNRFQKNCFNRATENKLNFDPETAFKNACNQLNIVKKINLIEKKSEKLFVYTEGIGDTIKIQLMYVPYETKLVQVWNFSVKEFKNNHWWDVCVDVNSGNIIFKSDWNVSCQFKTDNNSNQEMKNLLSNSCNHQYSEEIDDYKSGRNRGSGPIYMVYPLPFESPLYTSQKKNANPFGNEYSLNGWHDPIGSNENEDKTTKGNNVYVYEDADANDEPGYSPYANNNYEFIYPFDSTNFPMENRDAALTQLFYINNMVHDISYANGFDEESGNFQETNFNKGGVENDFVYAEALDGSGFDNANFSTPPDGQNPRMQMFVWKVSETSKFLKIESPSNLMKDLEGVLASFGPENFPLISKKEIVLYDDNTAPDINDACENPINGSTFSGKIVVIRRGICKFSEKVKRAQDFGAVAVIIVNNTTSSPLFSMSGNNSNGVDTLITIPSLLISLDDGNSLINDIVNNTVIASINPKLIAKDKDSGFDNGIIVHEYAHGISNRLTGGPSNSSCLNNDEQMGEGWSDYYGLMLTLRKYDFIKDRRVMGLYALNQDSTGLGIRPAPYSTDFNVNNFTYKNLEDSVQLKIPHGIGFVWATMLWDMTAGLVEKHGFDTNLVQGKGGNNIALKLVTYGLKLQPCSPGFVDGRDAILLADELLYNGENKNLIWCAFAKRGLGYSASQGSSENRFDQVEAFDLPPNSSINITSCGPYIWPINNITYTKSGSYSNSSGNDCKFSTTLNLTVLSAIDTSVTRQDGDLLKANQALANYQWLDCDNNYSALNQEISQVFKPSNNGNYSVKISNLSCIDTSSCYSFKTLNLIEPKGLTELLIYPNPTNGEIHIESKQTLDIVYIKLIDMMGKVVHISTFSNTTNYILNTNLEKGAYELELSDGKGNYNRQKLVVVY